MHLHKAASPNVSSLSSTAWRSLKGIPSVRHRTHGRSSTALQPLCSLRARSAATSSRDDSMDRITSTAFSISASASVSDLQIEPVIKPLDVDLRGLEVLATAEKKYEALAAWIGAAIAFGCGIWYFEGASKAQEYFAGYLLEQSLSVDNLFVFVLVFGFFKTPQKAQDKALAYGILSASVLRAIMIIIGIDLIESFRPILIFFAGILIFTAYKLIAESGQDEDEEEDLSNNFVVKLCRQYIQVTDSYDKDKFFTTTADGVRMATPLLLVLAVIELSDVLFAVDSIPAVFGVTLDPFIVYSSNIFAICSLRSLYGFVSGMMSELRYLDKAVAAVLGFIGVKMLIGFADIEIPTSASLLAVAGLLGGGVAASLWLPAETPAAEKASE